MRFHIPVLLCFSSELDRGELNVFQYYSEHAPLALFVDVMSM